MSEYVALARTLPPRLTHFFARWPPGSVKTAYASPFHPTYHPATHKWHNPIFSLRRQAELCKLARQYGVEGLLPLSRKSSAERERMREERARRGIRAKGTKGERTLKARIEERRKAMEEMPEMIREWKALGHGRGWKKWPSGRARR